MSDEWIEVENGQRNTRRRRGKIGLTGGEVVEFLEKFKTTLCQRCEPHDPRGCPSYHNDGDRRRNPFEEYYDTEACSNLLERMYHPVIFRTNLCQRTKCPFPRTCAFAHSDKEVRNKVSNSEEYEAVHAEKQLLLNRAASKIDLTALLRKENQSHWRDACDKWTRESIPVDKRVQLSRRLTEKQLFLIRKSGRLLKSMEDSAIGELAFVSYNERSLVVEGPRERARNALEQCFQQLESQQSTEFVVESRNFSERVFKKLCCILETNAKTLLGNEKGNVFVEVDTETTSLKFSAVNSRRRRNNAKALVNRVLEKIDFWVAQENYDKYFECCCCFEERNKDEGVQCANGHFYCSIYGCFSQNVKSQISMIQVRDDEPLLCPSCNSHYDAQMVAQHVDKETWDLLQKTILDKRVESERQELQRAFNDRLQEAIAKERSMYGQADAALKEEAKREALNIRNTVMNLCCPHCGIAYFEFNGCMALKCETCKGNFCGYCHKSTETSRGAHNHVRECLMNVTPDGSYYADADTVKEAQRQYRTRTLKKHLRQFKKSLQNAIVIELAQDLEAVNIQQEALFEVGNLQEE